MHHSDPQKNRLTRRPQGDHRTQSLASTRNSVVMGASVLEKKMHYPVMTERQLAARWKISLKTLRRWRADNEGPTWHKLFQYVRHHEAEVLDFERLSAKLWLATLGDGERVPKVVTRSPQAKRWWWRGLMPDRVTSPRSPEPHHRGFRRTCPPAASPRP